MKKQAVLVVLTMLALIVIGSAGRGQSIGAATEVATDDAPDGSRDRPFLNPCTGQPFVTVATDAAIASAHPAVNVSGDNRWVVRFRLADNEEAHRFSDYTAKNIGQQLAIVVDGRVLTAPTVQAALTTGGDIAGNFTREAASKLAIQLRTGPLPMALTFESTETTKDGLRLILGAPVADDRKLNETQEIIRRRLDDLEVPKATVAVSGGKIVVDLPGGVDSSALVDVITQPGLLEFVDFSKPQSCAAELPTADQYVLTDVQVSRLAATPAATTSAK